MRRMASVFKIVWSENEKKLFNAIGLDYLMEDVTPLDLYRMAAEKSFADNETGPHVEAVRKVVKMIRGSGCIARGSQEFEDMIAF